MKKILIVDDEAPFLLSLKDGLSVHNEDFTVLTAGNGQEAVNLLEQTQVDLLVTDLKLPVMDGFELLAYVTRNNPSLSVIVMTAFGTPDIEKRLAETNAIGYLEKPLDFDVLEKTIFDALKAGSHSIIRGIGLATFLQLVIMEKKTCTLKISALGSTGYLYIRQGKLLDAETETTTGMAAALDIVAWDQAEIEMDGICRKKSGPITSSIDFLLMEAFRLKDERQESKQRAIPRQKARSREKVSRASLEALLDYLKRSTDFREYAIFDDKHFTLHKSPGECSIANLAPGMQLDLATRLGALMPSGPLRFLVYSTRNRSRHLLFKLGKGSVLISLKPGANPAPVMAEVDRIRTTKNPTGQEREK